MKSFNELVKTQINTNTSLCVGIDPHKFILDIWGLPYNILGLREFCKKITDIIIETKVIVKPQIAFFEVFGSKGYQTLEDLIIKLRSEKILVISDIKRGDIDSTIESYNTAWLSNTSLESDAITINGFLGEDTIETSLNIAKDLNKGIFILARTSNSGARKFQDSTIDSTSISLSQYVINYCTKWNESDTNKTAGLVIGATTMDNSINLSHYEGNILMPGFGFQGAGLEIIKKLAKDQKNINFIPNISRDILKLGPEPLKMINEIEKIKKNLKNS